MFKNTLKITNTQDFTREKLAEVTWQEQTKIVDLLNQYLPKHICEIVPLEDNHYLISWNSIDGFESLLKDELYNLVKSRLTDFGIVLEFLEG